MTLYSIDGYARILNNLWDIEWIFIVQAPGIFALGQCFAEQSQYNGRVFTWIPGNDRTNSAGKTGKSHGGGGDHRGIGPGLLTLVGVQRGDNQASARRLLDKILGYRVFPDAEQRMNLSLKDIHGGLLLVPQFTLAADTRKGTRASFTPAAAPDEAQSLFTYLLEQARESHKIVEAGVFGADMQVHLVNDGPVTFWLQTPPAG
jgi:D-tyrosyl-tRNA(Tyr) deacylase